MGSDPRVLVLGPVQITQSDLAITVGGGRAQTVLAALVIGLRHTVSDDRLIDAVWGDSPPEDATASLQSHISRLRRHLGTNAILRIDHSYLLDIDPRDVDACRFERLFARATELAGDEPDTARELCREALDLWRGPPFGDPAGADFAPPQAIRLEELRADAVEL